MKVLNAIKASILDYCQQEFGIENNPNFLNISLTNPNFRSTGDYSFNFNGLRKFTTLDNTAFGEKLINESNFKLVIAEYDKGNFQIASAALKTGFINVKFSDLFWQIQLQEIAAKAQFTTHSKKAEKVLVEYGGPNTNKPLHIGHVRNMFLGFAMCEILKANGYKVIKANIYNDRGIAICKSMAAYIERSKGATPESTGIKGDHFVGDYYVLFGRIVEEQLRAIHHIPEDVANVYKHLGKEREVAEQETPIFQFAKELLLKWEAGEEQTVNLWKEMNAWVYEGFNQTYNNIGVDFEKNYYESETYKLGKSVITEGLEKKVFYKRADGAVAIDLTADGLDEKVLLRSDGTSIYITQDLGTAQLRYDEFAMDKMVYVVANEQDYHFKVLKLALQKLGKKWADGIYHLSYALVESPTGRFKSREGKTADADDLIAEVLRIAEEQTKALGKIDGFTNEQAEELYKTIGLGALKFFVLRVNPYKKIIFNPEESIDFHGHTGPYIQFAHARICAILRKAGAVEQKLKDAVALSNTERDLILMLSDYPNMLTTAAEKYDPSEVANYVYKLAQAYSKFYSEQPVLAAENEAEKKFRVLLSAQVARLINEGMKLLGIRVPEKM
ncbi:MAG: arginine--tRNA ligase [Chitinophagales bacterium]|nr:arginine--tRNA ligase [Chitinophagales bacterium]